MPTDINPSDTNGVKWVKLQAWLKQACENAGIHGDGSDPLLTDINTGDTEGVKWAKLQRWMKLLAENIGSGPAVELVESAIKDYPIGFASVDGVLTLDVTSFQIKNYVIQVTEDITSIVVTGIPVTAEMRNFKATMTFLQTDPGGYNVTFPSDWEFIGGVPPIIDKRLGAKTVVDIIVNDFYPAKIVACVRYPQHRIGITEVTASRDLALSDADSYLYSSSGSAVALTIQADTIPVGAEVDVFQAGAGQVSFVAGTDVTIISKGSNKKLSAQGSAATLKHVTANTWHLVGDLTA